MFNNFDTEYYRIQTCYALYGINANNVLFDANISLFILESLAIYLEV